jgi:hypothetical protein
VGVALAIGLSQPGLSLSSFHIIPIVVPAFFYTFLYEGGGRGKELFKIVSVKLQMYVYYL